MGKVRQRGDDDNRTLSHLLVKTIRLAMDDYVDTLNSWGETILVWADPENKFRGYTEVRQTEQS